MGGGGEAEVNSHVTIGLAQPLGSLTYLHKFCFKKNVTGTIKKKSFISKMLSFKVLIKKNIFAAELKKNCLHNVIEGK